MVPTLVEHNRSNVELDADSLKILDFFREKKEATLGEAVGSLSVSNEMEEHEILKRIYLLKEGGLVDLTDPSPPTNFTAYLLSTYSIWFWILTIIVIATIGMVYAPNIILFIYLRYLFGSVFVLYLPGAALIEILYPKKKELSQIERVTLSIGVSLAIIPLIALVLSYSPFEVRLDPILFSLSIFTLCLGLGAAKRKYSFLGLM